MNQRNLFILALFLSACSPKPAAETSAKEEVPTNNSMTRYVGELQTDTQRARTNADKMNKGIAAEESMSKDLDSQIR